MATHTTFELSGPRRIIRRGLAWVLAASAAIAALGFVLPAHLIDGEWHSYYRDDGDASLFSIAVLSFVFAVTLALRHRRFGSGMLTGALASGGAMAAMVVVAFIHLSPTSGYGFGATVFGIGWFVLFFGGAVLFVTEPVLYILEKRSRARPQLPDLPVAHVV